MVEQAGTKEAQKTPTKGASDATMGYLKRQNEKLQREYSALQAKHSELVTKSRLSNLSEYDVEGVKTELFKMNQELDAREAEINEKKAEIDSQQRSQEIGKLATEYGVEIAELESCDSLETARARATELKLERVTKEKDELVEKASQAGKFGDFGTQTGTSKSVSDMDDKEFEAHWRTEMQKAQSK